MSSNHRDGKEFNVDVWEKWRKPQEELTALLKVMRARKDKEEMKTITPKEQALIAELKKDIYDPSYIEKIEAHEREVSKPKYSLEIDTGGAECDRYDRWANYGLITCEGNNLEELFENAMVDIMDQDGGELDIVPADSKWMQDMIEVAFKRQS